MDHLKEAIDALDKTLKELVNPHLEEQEAIFLEATISVFWDKVRDSRYVTYVASNINSTNYKH